jgi:hypothetical protein
VSFSDEELRLLQETAEVRIETQAPGKPARRTIIWIVVDGGDAFIRSWKGPGARWYRSALANPAVAVVVDDRRLPATAIPATDPDSVERVSTALKTKYAGDPAAASMVRPEILDTTLRLEPA